MKALEYLKQRKLALINHIGCYDTNKDEYTIVESDALKNIDEAISELEALQDRSCDDTNFIDEATSDILGYLAYYPHIGKMKPNTKYKIYMVEVEQ